MRIPLIAGNWKMNGTPAGAEALLQKLAKAAKGRAEMAVFPPFTAIWQAEKYLKGTFIRWGAQNVYPEEKGAYTGEISPDMLKEMGCSYVICGHSERRQLLGETDAFINRKIHALFRAGIVPVLCAGETAEERRDGRTAAVLQREIEEGLRGIDAADAGRMIIAYEPVWAIGAGQAASAEEAEEAAGWIRECVFRLFGREAADTVRILYGGSVSSANIASFMQKPDIDGALVGGASLKAEEFISIYNRADA